MTYNDSIEYLSSLEKFGSKLKLNNIKNLTNELGNPQKSLKIIHVAGTNGKGSVCNMLSSILQEAGYNVGFFTSPHLNKYNEMIKINDKNISDKDFAIITQAIILKCSTLVDSGKEHPTFFECLTAMSFYYFQMSKVDYVILEVGLGGRNDATNVIKNPLLSIITSISMDHQESLGKSLLQISKHKGGIIKKNCPVVLAPNKKEVVNTIEKIAIKMNSDFYYHESKDIITNIISSNYSETNFSIDTPNYYYKTLQISFLGRHQLENASTVLLATQVLQKMNIGISEYNIIKGLKNAKWKCRMEIIKEKPLILLDAAHNPSGMDALYEVLTTYFKKKKKTLVFGVFKDKDYESMINIVSELFDNIIFTEPDTPRALSTDKLLPFVNENLWNVIVEKDYKKAIEKAQEITSDSEMIVCAGSLYLVGKIRGLIVR